MRAITYFYINCFFQAHAAVKWVSGKNKLPFKEKMLQDLEAYVTTEFAKGYSKRRFHYLFRSEKEYLESLATLCDIERLPDVIFSICSDALDVNRNPRRVYRGFKYTIIDSSHFSRTKI